MCGIAGILKREALSRQDRGILTQMSRALVHRGPDGHGSFVSGPIGLTHRRLSVIDIAGGGQPMIDPRSKHALVFNGEIYNFRELRTELESEGHTFVTRSDTEVLLRLGTANSLDWVSRLNGMFAFGLWAEGDRRLVLGRDRLGIKPLFYAALDHALVFASEIKALLQHPDVARSANIERVPEYLAFRSLAGSETMFKGIHKIPPGHVITVSQQDLAIRSRTFWSRPSPDPVPVERPARDVRADLKSTLQRAVERQLISDVPVGVYLSGGVDSSLITTFIRSSRRDNPLHTFSVAFDESEYDESRYATSVAARVGATHHLHRVTERDYVDQLQRTVVQLDEPMNHAHTVHLELLSRFAKSHVTVALTGEGADELFGGYPRLHIPLLAKRLAWLPTVVADGVRSVAHSAGYRRVVKLLESGGSERDGVVHGARFVPRHDFDRLYPAGSAYSTPREQVYDQLSQAGLSGVARILAFDQQTYLPSLLSRLDSASMAAAVECRVPFLDNEMIDFSLTVPANLKIAGRENKIVLKQVAAQVLPPDVVYRRKNGFGTPLPSWFRHRGGVGAYLDLLVDPSARTASYLDQGSVKRLVTEHRGGAEDHSEALWGLLALELWHRHVVESAPIDECPRDESEEEIGLEPIDFGSPFGPALYSGALV